MEDPTDVLDDTLNDVDNNEDQDTQRFLELNSKKDRSEEENAELDTIKKSYGKKVQKRLFDQKTKYERQLEDRDRKLEDYEKRLKEMESRGSADPKPSPVVEDTVKVGDKAFYTDAALESLIKAGKMDTNKAYEHRDERLIAQAEERAFSRMTKKQQEEKEKEIQQQRIGKVQQKYPHFLDARHPEHDPKDPLYVEANRLYQNGLAIDVAIETAEKLLKSPQRPDVSDDLSLTRGRGSISTDPKGKAVSLNPQEKAYAIQLYVDGGRINPKTKRVYTEREAIEKMQTAKDEDVRLRAEKAGGAV